MRSARSKLFFSLCLAGGMLLAAQGGFAAEQPKDQVSRQLEEIQTRLAALDQQQKEILANQEEIFKRLDQLRIWVHRK